MRRACGEFALRAEFGAGRPRRLGRAAAALIAAGLCAGLASCADDGAYPSLAKIEDVGTVLTPEERQKAVEDLRARTREGDGWKVSTQ